MLHQSAEFVYNIHNMKRTLNTTINRSKSEKNDESKWKGMCLW